LGIELAEGHDGSAVSKTRRRPYRGIKKPGTLQKLNERKEQKRPQRNNAKQSPRYFADPA
jgi:hypothetical protein